MYQKNKTINQEMRWGKLCGELKANQGKLFSNSFHMEVDELEFGVYPNQQNFFQLLGVLLER